MEVLVIKDTLEECIQYYFKKRKTVIMCQQCKSQVVDGTQKRNCRSLPEYLLINLNRFEDYNQNKMNIKKCSYPFKLDLTKHLPEEEIE